VEKRAEGCNLTMLILDGFSFIVEPRICGKKISTSNYDNQVLKMDWGELAEEKA